MFDVNLGSRKGRSKIAAAMLGDSNMQSSQAHMPLDGIEDDGLMRTSDGGKSLFLSLPGVNVSLLTEDQQRDLGMKLSQVFSASSADRGAVFILPEQVSSESNLALADRSIRRFSERIYGSSAGTDEDRRCLGVLENHIRPQLAREAVATTSIQWRVCLGQKWYGTSDDDARTAARSLVPLIAKKLGKPSHVLDRAEVLDLLDLYIRAHVPGERFLGAKFVMPSVR